MSEFESIPFAQISGFLGAGKTTLVNRVLYNNHDKRIVVFVNDFGAINIDYDLIKTADADRISLTNGCVCCSLNQDLTQTIMDVCNERRPDAFLLEASGVADPHAVQRSLIPMLQAGHIHLAQQVSILDVNLFGTLGYEDTEELIDSAAASDLVLLNKCDLATTEKLAEIMATLARSAPFAELVQTSFCEIDHNIFYHRSVRASNPASSGNSFAEDRFESISLTDFGALYDSQFDHLVDTLRKSCLRAKGTLFLNSSPDTPLLFQFTGSHHSLCEMPFLKGATHSRLVAIGWAGALDREKIRSLLTNSAIV